MRNKLAGVWQPVKGVAVKDIGAGRFLFQFFHVSDLKRVRDGGPWSFDNNMLVIHQVLPGEVPALVPLNHLDIWVQIHHLPIGFMSENVGKQIGNYVGAFVEYDVKNNSTF
ncbi:hypothetical protein PTKIN_Ptkin05aG0101600 [Pterospermum kingtungense]